MPSEIKIGEPIDTDGEVPEDGDNKNHTGIYAPSFSKVFSACPIIGVWFTLANTHAHQVGAFALWK
jgi:hypothetical protein